MLVVTTGYFAYDTLAMTYFGLLNFDITLHHVAVFFAFGQSLIFKPRLWMAFKVLWLTLERTSTV